MKKCVIVSDSFKGTLSSLSISSLAQQAITEIFPECEAVAVPVADGGEGTVECFIKAVGAAPQTVEVSGPHFEPMKAVYARKGGMAIIEMASAAGLPLVGNEGNPELTTTFGVGELIRSAVDSGCREILLGIGGSCTNDGGCGCAAALGARFFDEDGAAFVPMGGTLDKIRRIDIGEARRLLENVRITVMCDVDNPLHGPRGAAHIFAPQKGADENMVRRLDSQLKALDLSLESELGLRIADVPGAGAAGGMGAGCIAFLGAELKSGIEAVLDAVDFDTMLDSADFVFTGEGRIDSQSVHGKVISGIAKRTSPRGIPLIAIVGSIAEDSIEAYELGVTAMFGIDRAAVAFEEYADRSDLFYRRTLLDVLRVIRAAQKL